VCEELVVLVEVEQDEWVGEAEGERDRDRADGRVAG
jgi:hypothetical protein